MGFLIRALVSVRSYDLLCLEGLAMALRVFLLKDPIPTFRVSDIPRSSVQKMVVKPEVRRFLKTLFFLCSIRIIHGGVVVNERL